MRHFSRQPLSVFDWWVAGNTPAHVPFHVFLSTLGAPLPPLPNTPSFPPLFPASRASFQIVILELQDGRRHFLTVNLRSELSQVRLCWIPPPPRASLASWLCVGCAATSSLAHVLRFLGSTHTSLPPLFQQFGVPFEDCNLVNDLGCTVPAVLKTMREFLEERDAYSIAGTVAGVAGVGGVGACAKLVWILCVVIVVRLR